MSKTGRRFKRDLRLLFGSNLRHQRDAAGLTQEELAYRAGLNRTTISLLERGKRMPGLDTMAALAVALDLAPLDELLAGVSVLARGARAP